MTAPFGPVLEAALKENIQGGRLGAYKGVQVHPQFYCCLSGTSVGIAKDPVAMLFLSATRVCMNTAVTADYSNSWSPSSTIAAWEVDWGDGNTSNGAWPGGGSVAHPGGGYTLPITYTVTLTVTDLLGATGIAEVQIEVIDCSVEEIDVFAGCGASGAWKSETGGLNWDDVSYGVLDGVKIHDIKANWFTIGTESVEVWAATENGVYTSTAGSIWTRKELPLPGAYLVEPTPVAITCSKYDPLEVYVLATSAAGVTWLYRTVDAGETWTYMRIGPMGASEPTGGGVIESVSALHWDSTTNRMWIIGPGCYPNSIYNCNFVIYWEAGAYHVIENIVATSWGGSFVEDQTGDLWISGTFYQAPPVLPFPPCYDVIQQSIGGWTVRPASVDCAGIGLCYLGFYNGDVYVGGQGIHIQRWQGGAWQSVGAPDHIVYTLKGTSHYLYVGGSITDIDGVTTNYIGRWNGVTWDGLNGGVSSNVYAIQANADGTEIYIGGSFTAAGTGADVITAYRFAMWDEVANEWSSPCIGLERLDNNVYAIAVSATGDVYVGGAFTATTGGTTLNHIARWSRATDTWAPVGSGFNGNVQALEFDEDGNLWVGGNFTQDGDGNPVAYISMIGPGSATPAAVGRTNLIAMSADGQYVYVSLIDSSNNPVVVRVGYELSGLVNIYNPGSGTWGGVAADSYYSNVLWMFGDFGGEKILLSEDWGETNTDQTDAGWNAGEVVRPLLVSAWESSDVVAILNLANESWRTKDWGTAWAKQGDTGFDCQSGARDPFEPENIWIGREDVGANHIQYSPNSGVNWDERSGGFAANAPVTALQVTK